MRFWVLINCAPPRTSPHPTAPLFRKPEIQFLTIPSTLGHILWHLRSFPSSIISILKQIKIFMKKIVHPNKLRTLINCAPFFVTKLELQNWVRWSLKKLNTSIFFISTPSEGVLSDKLSRNEGCGKSRTFFCDQVRASELGQMVSKKIKNINILYINPIRRRS